MNPAAPLQVIADSSRNLLRIAFAGTVTAANLQPFFAESRKALADLARGFSLLVDLTDLSEMEMECAPLIEANMELFRDHGVKLVVRVIPDRSKDIGFSIMALFHYPRGLKTITVETRAEAETLLA